MKRPMRSQQRVARAFLLYFQEFDFNTSKIVAKTAGTEIIWCEIGGEQRALLR
jgi:hypothetical protein